MIDCIHRGHLIGDGHAHKHRLLLATLHESQPRHALDHRVVAGLMGIWPLSTKTRDRKIHNPGIALSHCRIIEAQALHHARPEVLHQYITLRSHLQNCLSRFRTFEIKLDTTLVAVETDKPRAHAGFEGEVQVAQDVAASGFDLNDIGSQIAHQHRAKRTSNHTTETSTRTPERGPPIITPSFTCPTNTKRVQEQGKNEKSIQWSAFSGQPNHESFGGSRLG